MNYVDLRAAIQQYTENYENSFAERIDTFIRQAENRIPHMVRLPPTRKASIGFMAADSQYLAPPSDYLSCDGLFVEDEGRYHPVENKEPEFIRVCFPDLSYRGRPRYYGKVDDKMLLLGPVPGQDYPMRMHYFAYPQSICDTVDGKSYMGTFCESLLLYQSLVEAYTYMKGEPNLLAFYKQRADEAAGNFKLFGDGKARKDSYQEPDARMVETRN